MALHKLEIIAAAGVSSQLPRRAINRSSLFNSFGSNVTKVTC